MLQRFTRRQLLALLPGGLLVATSRAQALEEGRSVLGYQLDLSILFNFLTLSLAGKVVQEIDRRAGRYRVTMDGKGTAISTRTEATGIILLRLAQFWSKNTPCSSLVGLKSSRQIS